MSDMIVCSIEYIIKLMIVFQDAYHPAVSTLEPEGLQLELKLVLFRPNHELRIRACDSSIH